VPSTVEITATGDELLREGIPASAMVDGWSVTYDRTLVSFGHFSAEGDDCVQYSSPDYARILDMQREGAQRVNIIHALGTCVLDFELNGSGPDEPVGEGVTEADKTFMLTLSDDPYSNDAGPTIYLEGHADKDGQSKSFAWSYRHSIDYEECGPIVNGRHTPKYFEFSESGEATVDFAVRGRAVFQQSLYAAEPQLGFDVFALADDMYGDGNGAVTIEELAAVPLAEVATVDRYADANAPRPFAVEDDNEPRPWETLGDYVYFGLFPLVLRMEGDGVCGQDRFVNDRNLD
jgi:hypothetical protein